MYLNYSDGWIHLIETRFIQDLLHLCGIRTYYPLITIREQEPIHHSASKFGDLGKRIFLGGKHFSVCPDFEVIGLTRKRTKEIWGVGSSPGLEPPPTPKPPIHAHTHLGGSLQWKLYHICVIKKKKKNAERGIFRSGLRKGIKIMDIKYKGYLKSVWLCGKGIIIPVIRVLIMLLYVKRVGKFIDNKYKHELINWKSSSNKWIKPQIHVMNSWCLTAWLH